MDKIGQYEILEALHVGPQPLYRAKAPDGRIVAIKTIPVKGLSPEMRERFMREADTCKTLDHPNLVRVFEFGEADGMLFQVMEFLVGSDLGKIFSESRKFSWDEKLSIMEQVCDGLQYAHDHKLVHRDIKPANLFLEDSGRVRVVDFGMVRVEESELTRAGAAVGTLNYMAPEQIRGERCTAASDVFSAGIVFFQLASGQHPFSQKGWSLFQVVGAIVHEAPPKLSALCPDAPEGLEFVLNKALEKDPTKRIQNAGDLKQAMSLCRITMKLGGGPKAAPPAPTPMAGETKIMPAAKADGGSAIPAAPAPDDQKTKVMKRPVVPGPLPPAIRSEPAPAPPPPRPAPPKPATSSTFRFCPSCTSANPPTATICRGCGAPLGGGEVPAPPAPPTPWAMYIAIGVAVLLAIALVVVLIVKK